MTERFNSLTVVFDQDIRQEDAKKIIDAILMIKHVLNVKGNIPDINYYVAHERVRYEISEKLFKTLHGTDFKK